MNVCPNCSKPLGFLTLACHQDVVVCRGCKAELTPDNRSIACLYLGLAAFLPIVVLISRYIRGLSFGWAVVVGFCAGLAGALVASSVFVRFVRLRVKCEAARARRPASAHP